MVLNCTAPVAFTASPIRQEGRTVGTIIEVRDIREEKAREREASGLDWHRAPLPDDSRPNAGNVGLFTILDGPPWQCKE